MSDERLEFLRRSALWASLSEEVLRSVAAAMHPMKYRNGQALLRQGEAGGHLHVLTSGRAEVRVHTAGGTVVTVAEIQVGDLFGEMSLLTGDPASADIVATQDSETLMLERRVFNALVTANSNLLREFVRMVSRRLSATVLAVGASREREEELTRFLLEEKSERYGDLADAPRIIKALQRQIEEQAQLDTPLLIRGERGTGKELIARRIHFHSSRKNGPLLKADCTQIAETPWGDQLFGDYSHREMDHARPNRTCYMELALGGTMLLKNIDALPPAIQERLLQFLQSQWQGFGSRHLVRVIATCRGDLADGASAGQMAPALAAALSEHVIVLPPLRERKRDIPELARHFVRKHAQRLNKRVEGLDDHAIIKLVSYDYHIANVQELEEAIERGVILSDDDTIDAEEIFLGPPPTPRPHGYNLLELPEPLVRTALRLFPAAFRGLVAVVFALILYECFFVPTQRGGNLGTLLVWSLWWPMLVLSFIFAGRAWCAVCPMALAGGAAQRVSNLERHIPAWLKNHDAYIVMAGFFAIVWVEAVTGMRHSPHATGVLLLFIAGGALIASVLFPRRTWCRHLCPLGGLAGLCSTSALVELRPTFDVCTAKCKGHSCYKGGDGGIPGCPMFQHVMFVDSNQHCVLCMNCVRSCPNQSPQFNVRMPGYELWTSLTARPEMGRFVALLLGLTLGQTFIQHLELRPHLLMSRLLVDHRFIFVSCVLLLSAGIPLLGLWLATRRVGQSSEPDAMSRFWKKVVSWVPLATAAYACHQLSFFPGLDNLKATFGYTPLQAGAARMVSFSLLSMSQAGLLIAGLAITIGTLWRLWQVVKEGEKGSWIRDQAVSLVGAVVYWTFMLVLTLRPEWLIV